MAKGITRTKAKVKGGKTVVKILAKHPMETGNRKDKNGKKIPAKYIQSIKIAHNGNTVIDAFLGTAVSANPYLGFSFAGGAKGDEIQITWTENSGATNTETASIR